MIASVICPHCHGQVKLASMYRPLTRTQRAQLVFILTAYEREGVAPSFAEIAQHFGYRTLATVHEALGRLARGGYLLREFNQARGITPLVRLDDLPGEL